VRRGTAPHDATQRVTELCPVPAVARAVLRALLGHPGFVELLLAMFSGITPPNRPVLRTVLEMLKVRPAAVPVVR
jgi:hypothetical protein